MQTLLLVDDEPNIVEGLASQFEQRYGDGVIVLKSCSGRHALSVLQNNRVDVVLSDIRMPDLDGLELIEETERLWPRTHFVLLSGFEDFDYIHRAVSYTHLDVYKRQASRTARSVAARSYLRLGRGAPVCTTPAISEESPTTWNISSMEG